MSTTAVTPSPATLPTFDLGAGPHAVRGLDLRAAAAQRGVALDAMPFVIRVLAENLCRHALWSGGRTVKESEIDAVMHWRERIGDELPLHVSRVLLPDSSGIPVLQDLAALRDAAARAGVDPAAVDVRLPLDLIVDHSLQVDEWGSPGAVVGNLRAEFARNTERYAFIKWAQQAFRGLRVWPPGTGIIHQVNLEQIAQVVMTADHDGRAWAFPDFVLGGDSHTPMVNALGVLGWGVGGIDAEIALLGRAYTFPVPRVIGVRLHGQRNAATFTTDLALRVTEILRGVGIVNSAVEFFGPAVADLSVPERATLANMAPEYGATCAFFPVDAKVLDYLRTTGRTAEQIGRVEAYSKRNGLFRDAASPLPIYAQIVEIDLADVTPCMAGPRRPQDRVALHQLPAGFRSGLTTTAAAGGFGVTSAPEAEPPAAGVMPQHGAVVIAAITSCTNTSNPEVMLAAGIVAKKAAARGLRPPAWVKTSLAPGSRSVTRYLEQAGLLEPLAALGFYLIGYGCTTCGGKSGPLSAEVSQRIAASGGVAVAVLSGNRNFEGRIHKLVRANYIGAPPMVVIYALAGRIDIDLQTEPLGHDQRGGAVYMRELMPTPQELADAMRHAAQPAHFAPQDRTDDPAVQAWNEIDAARGPRFPWRADSSYLIEPPFFAGDAGSMRATPDRISGARVLAAFGDSLTTDHVSPGGEIPLDTPAGRYLAGRGIQPRDFNTYVGRRGNYHVMARATFANIRLHNALVEGVEGGFTRHFPDGERVTIFDAATAYRVEGVPLVVLAGKDYGTGSSRDWAAKGSALLGVAAVLAESFERIHRANLVGMGVLPLRFAPGEGWRQLGLQGDEVFEIEGIAAGIEHASAIAVTARAPGREPLRFTAFADVLTTSERGLMAEGGIPNSVVREFARQPALAS